MGKKPFRGVLIFFKNQIRVLYQFNNRLEGDRSGANTKPLEL
ncbi:hypothetical protein [Nostoc sp.]